MITINGQEQPHHEGETLLRRLEALGYRTDVVAVEHNGVILNRADFAATELNDGDKLEVVCFVGGG